MQGNTMSHGVTTLAQLPLVTDETAEPIVEVGS